MEQMNKQELIEYFIEQLGDNRVLGKWISKDDVYKKLDDVIGDVTYDQERNGVKSSWRVGSGSEKGTLNFDLNKISEKYKCFVIVHELLHALLTTIYKEKNKTVIKIGLALYDTDDNNYIENISISEGQTDYIAEQIMGVPHDNDGYILEKDIYKLLAIIIGADKLLDYAFSQTIEESFTHYISNCVINQYGNGLGTEYSNALRKIMKLLDEYTTLQNNDVNSSIDNTNKNIRSTIENEIYSLLRMMLKKIIDNEEDFSKKIDMLISCFQTNLGQDVSERVLGELVNCDKYNINQKLDILYKVKQEEKSYIPNAVVKEIILNPKDSDTLSAEDKLRHYIELVSDNTSIDFVSTVCELYFRTGRISEEIFNKKNAFLKLINNKKIKTVDDLYMFIDSIKYRKIGNYYEIDDGNNYNLCSNKIIIDKDGNLKKMLEISRDPLKNKNLTRFDREIISNLCSNADELWNNIKEVCLRQKDENNIECQVYIIGESEIRLQFFDDVIETKNVTYIIGSKGELIMAESEEERRFTDDMSQLDIELKKQTSDISLTEIMKQAENLYSALNNPKKIITDTLVEEEKRS